MKTCFFFWLDELTLQPKILIRGTKFPGLRPDIPSCESSHQGRIKVLNQEKCRKSIPPTLPHSLHPADTSLRACGSTKKKLNIGTSKLTPSFVLNRRLHRKGAEDRKATYAPNFALEAGYGLVNSFYSIYRSGVGLRAGELLLHHPCSDGVARIELKDNWHAFFRKLRSRSTSSL